MMDRDCNSRTQDLLSADDETRAAAARHFAILGESAAPAAVALVVCCGDPNEDVREWAAAALEECGPPDVRDAQQLAGLLVTTPADVAYWAATLLGRLRDGAGPFVEQISAALQDRTEPAVRQRIVWALGEIGPSAVGAVPAIKSIAATTDDPRLRRLAERALGEIRR